MQLPVWVSIRQPLTAAASGWCHGFSEEPHTRLMSHNQLHILYSMSVWLNVIAPTYCKMPTFHCAASLATQKMSWCVVPQGGKWEQKLLWHRPQDTSEEDRKVLKIHCREAVRGRCRVDWGTSLAGEPDVRKAKWDLPGFQQLLFMRTCAVNQILSVKIMRFLFKCSHICSGTFHIKYASIYIITFLPVYVWMTFFNLKMKMDTTGCFILIACFCFCFFFAVYLHWSTPNVPASRLKIVPSVSWFKQKHGEGYKKADLTK